jgi:hypothetical protein
MTHTKGLNTNTEEELHPLKKLRKICGISSATLSEITGIPANTIRAAEISRRKGGELSERQLSQILFSTGAHWDPKARSWIFIFTQEGIATHLADLYTRGHFETYRAELLAEASERAGAIGYLLLRLMAFLEAAPDSKFNGVFWQTYQLLDEWGAKKLPMALSPNWSEKEMRALGFRKEFCWLEDGNAKKFTELVDAYKAEYERAKGRDANASLDGEKPADSTLKNGKRGHSSKMRAT